MNRKDFLKKSLLGASAFGAAGLPNTNKPESELPQVGFEHLPRDTKSSNMKKVLHRAATRGHADHGWLDTHHTFSFANYRNPERIHFGALRVLNDDRVAAGRGFPKHSHDNMEIISIPLEGDLEHQDSMGNKTIIRQGDVQIMSAGRGVVHSEMNHRADREVKFLQIWVFPREKNIAPNYDQATFPAEERRNRVQTVVSPAGSEGIDIHQDAWFSMVDLDEGKKISYPIHRKGNGVYVFVLEGSVQTADETLHARDGIGVWETESLELSAQSSARLLLIEVPMTF